MKQFASLPLRFGLGIVFAAHGLQKAFGMFGGGGLQGFSGMLGSLGFPLPMFWAVVGTAVELLGGIALLLGVATKTAASLLFVQMIVAAVLVHLPNGFFAANMGIELPFVLACSSLALAFLGSGKFSISQKY